MLPTKEPLKKFQIESPHSPPMIGLGTAVPDLKLTQSEALEFILANFEIKESTRQLYKQMLRNQSIQTRYLALDRLSDILEKDLDRINARFEQKAVQLSIQSLQSALQSAHLSPQDLDY